MNIYAISDLHLSGFAPKPMNIFGGHWDGHWQKIRENWQETVRDEDIVLIPGDLSWAMRLDEAKTDVVEICAMPGLKLVIKGNHDYWWGSLSQVEALLTGNTYVIQNNSYRFGEYVFAGSRGWTVPGSKQYDPAADEKLYLREAARLELSLKHARKAAPDARLICMMHFPPADASGSSTLYTQLLEQYGATDAVYGHLHSSSIRGALSGVVRGVRYTLVSCDAAEFRLVKIV
jgi:predicted phosphohydrolase